MNKLFSLGIIDMDNEGLSDRLTDMLNRIIDSFFSRLFCRADELMRKHDSRYTMTLAQYKNFPFYFMNVIASQGLGTEFTFIVLMEKFTSSPILKTKHFLNKHNSFSNNSPRFIYWILLKKNTFSGEEYIINWYLKDNYQTAIGKKLVLSGKHITFSNE